MKRGFRGEGDGMLAALGWTQAVPMCRDSRALHLDAPSGQPRGLVCIGSPVSCVASYSM